LNEHEYALGFIDGEEAAWKGRNEPLPQRPPITNERARGYWDARLPRTAVWATRHKVAQSWWGDDGRRVMEAA
jgi:hypothetical protein